MGGCGIDAGEFSGFGGLGHVRGLEEWERASAL